MVSLVAMKPLTDVHLVVRKPGICRNSAGQLMTSEFLEALAMSRHETGCQVVWKREH